MAEQQQEGCCPLKRVTPSALGSFLPSPSPRRKVETPLFWRRLREALELVAAMQAFDVTRSQHRSHLLLLSQPAEARAGSALLCALLCFGQHRCTLSIMLKALSLISKLGGSIDSPPHFERKSSVRKLFEPPLPESLPARQKLVRRAAVPLSTAIVTM